MYLQPGDLAPVFQRQTIHGLSVSVPDARGRWVHLQFRRYAACPICNLHLRSFHRRESEIANAGIHEIVVFHASVEALLPYQGDLTFSVLADVAKELYRLFGVGTSPVALLHPGAWGAMVRGAVSVRATPVREGGPFGLPADFLLTPEGRISACHYGVHADDSWSVDTLLSIPRSNPALRV